jgi:hypothetical protein
MDADNRLVLIGQAARRLRVPVKWLQAEAEAGRIPHLKAGRAILVDPDLVEQVLLQRVRDGQGAPHAD